MIIKTEDYRIECIEQNKAVIIGVLRLPSPSAYDQHFKPIKDQIEKNHYPYTINIAQVDLLNSSGITALARLIFHAKELNVPLTIEASATSPWQKKTLESLQKLWSGLTITLS